MRFTYVGRNDDVFKSSDYRISPFELESLLIEHGASQPPDRATALSILTFMRHRSSPFKREFWEEDFPELR